VAIIRIDFLGLKYFNCFSINFRNGERQECLSGDTVENYSVNLPPFCNFSYLLRLIFHYRKAYAVFMHSTAIVENTIYLGVGPNFISSPVRIDYQI
jgi:hypothetical protein